LLEGKDTKEERQRATAARLLETRGAVTFRKVAMDFITDQAKNGRWKKRAKNVTKGSAHQWEQSLTDYAFPKIGALRIGDITREHVLEVLKPIWTKIPVAAKRVQERIEEILDWAAVKDLRAGENPARWKGYLSKILPATRKITGDKKFPRVPVEQLPAFMRHLRTCGGAAALALEWSILTMSRPGETRLMRRKDIDVEQRVWTIPAGRHTEGLKTAEARRVPLSGAALAVIEKVPGFDNLAPDALVFAGMDDGPLSENTLKAVIVRMHKSEVKAGRGGYTDPDQLHKTTGEPSIATPHGTSRSTTRDTLTERAHFEDWLLEKCLGHTEDNKTRGSYQRGDALAKQREVMEKLASLANGDE
jgi:integrase